LKFISKFETKNEIQLHKNAPSTKRVSEGIENG